MSNLTFDDLFCYINSEEFNEAPLGEKCIRYVHVSKSSNELIVMSNEDIIAVFNFIPSIKRVSVYGVNDHMVNYWDPLDIDTNTKLDNSRAEWIEHVGSKGEWVRRMLLLIVVNWKNETLQFLAECCNQLSEEAVANYVLGRRE